MITPNTCTLEWQKSKYDLEERTAVFAERVRDFCLKLPRNTINAEYVSQLIRAGSSPGANYIEANENVGPGDLRYRTKVSRKEAKESMHFLGLVEVFDNKEMEIERNWLVDEAGQLRKIFSAMLKKLDDSRSNDK